MERKIKSLSWSKINTFLEYPKNFIKTYFEEEPFFETKEILFWKVFSAFTELNTYNFDEIFAHLSKDRNWNEIEIEEWKIKILKESFENIMENEEFLNNFSNWQFSLFPKYEEYLQEFIEFKPAVNWVYSICCLWYLDNAKDDLAVFREFKTGKKPWDQERANNHWQIDFYALLIEAKTGKLPQKAYLDWIETEENETWIYPTWRIETFEVEINKEKVEKFKAELPKIFDDMQKAYEKWLQDAEKNAEMEVEIFEDYRKLELEKKEIEEKQKILKEKINKKLEEKQLDNFKIEWVWNFYYMNKKSYTYDENIVNLEKTQKEELKKLKTEFEKNNEPTITKTLVCKID